MIITLMLVASSFRTDAQQSKKGNTKYSEFDVVVYGGTSAGVTAAVQAARMGKEVVLIEPGGHLGGMTSSGLGRTDTGNTETIGGLAEEFYRRVGARYGTGKEKYTFEPHVAEQVFERMVQQAGVETVRGERLDRSGGGVRQKKDTIRTITMESGRTFRGRVFIDATYVGDLMAAAGVTYTIGRESKEKYGESLAGTHKSEKYLRVNVDPYVRPGTPSSGLLPGVQSETPLPEEGRGDDGVQAYNYRLTLTKRKGNRVDLTKPPGYRAADYELLAREIEKLKEQDHFPGKRGNRGDKLELRDFMIISSMPGGKTDINNWGYSAMSTDYVGGNYNYPDGSYRQRERIEEEHKQHIQGLFWFLANDERVPDHVREEMRQWGYAKDEYTDNDHWPYELYVREARRMIGEYVMTQANCEGKRNVDKSIGMGSYNMDSHTVRRYVNGDGHMRKDGFLIKNSKPYSISYHAITPRKSESKNLLVPVCLSASHIAFGSIRMEPVFMVLGQSAGAAAVRTIQEGGAVQDVGYDQLRKQLEADDQELYLGNEPLDQNEFSGRVMVVDDARQIGEWERSQSIRPFLGDGYYHDGNSGKGKKRIVFELPVREPGRYELQLAYPAHQNRARNVPVLIRHADGTSRETLDQTREPEVRGLFEPIGRYSFSPEKPARLIVSNTDTEQYVTVNAVQLIRLND